METGRTEDEQSAAKTTDIFSLPRELLVDILANVAASSFKDLYNAKLSCRFFKDLAEDGYVYRRASLDRVYIDPWHREKQQEVSFLEKCMHHGNSEALFKQAMQEYFHRRRTVVAIKYLERAVSSTGQDNEYEVVASYVLGVLYICIRNYGYRERGMELLKRIYSSYKYEECCQKIKDEILHGTWRHLHKNDILLATPQHFEYLYRNF